MAQATKKSAAIRIEEQWECQFSASPERVEKADKVTFTVALSHPLIGAIDASHTDFYALFSYNYDTHDPRLTIPVVNPAVVNSLPPLPDGDYAIDVTVTAAVDSEAIATWFLLPASLVLASQLGVSSDVWTNLGSRLASATTAGNSLGDTASLSVVTRLIETQSQVTLQRTFAGPTDDRALWPAIRNRTAAIGFDRYKKFIDCVFCEGNKQDAFNNATKMALSHVNPCLDDPTTQNQLSIFGPYAYSVLKLATQVFLTLESGVVIRDNTPESPRSSTSKRSVSESMIFPSRFRSL
jgi:hypothetical protein